MKNIPKIIYDLDMQMYSISNQLFEIFEEITRIEIQARMQISSEINDKGKPVYSNEQSRSDALWLTLDGNKEYKDLASRKKSLLSERDFLKIKKEYYKNVLLVIQHEIKEPEISEEEEGNRSVWILPEDREKSGSKGEYE